MARKKAEVVELFGKGTGGGDSGGPEDHNANWRDKLVLNKEGDAKSTAHNIKTILVNHEDMVDLFRLDEFANRIMICGTAPWGAADAEFTERTAFDVAAWMGQPETFKMGVKPVQIMEAVEAVAETNKFHPVREYLDRQVWDGEERIPTLFSDYFGSEQNDYTRGVALIFMISAVARIYAPGCKVDTMLVLEGKQGAGKSTAVRDLFSTIWHAEAMESPNSKDFYQSQRGNWVIEIGELSSFSKAEVHKVKQMLSAQYDTYRPSYGRYARKFPRQGVFVGTTNEDDWNRDYTGARRFLPIRCTEIDVPALRSVRDQLWAEAVARYKRNEQWGRLPDGADVEQDARFQEDSWMELVDKWLNGIDLQHSSGNNTPDQYPDVPGMLESMPGRPDQQRVMFCSSTDVLRYALRIDVGKHGKPEQMRIGNMMKRIGWERLKRPRGTQRRWEYVRPADRSPPPAAAAEVSS